MGNVGWNVGLPRGRVAGAWTLRDSFGNDNYIGTVHGHRQRDPRGWLSWKNHILVRLFDRVGVDRPARAFLVDGDTSQILDKNRDYPLKFGRSGLARQRSRRYRTYWGGEVGSKHSMADYYSLIARAVAGLTENTSEARHALYERARAAFYRHLPGAALSKADIVAHRLSLEEAIRKVEAESARTVSYSTDLRSGMKPTEFVHSEKPTSAGLPFLGISLAIRALHVNRLRSVLTALGIVLGVAAVVCMVAVGAGARSQISEKISKLGTNLLFVQPYIYASRARQSLTEDDAAAMLREVPGVQISAPVIWGSVQVIAGNRHLNTTVWGNDSDYLIAREWPVTAGRLFSREEIASGSKVAIIGQEIADKLFDGKPRIGETIRIDSVPFTIVGVLEKKGDSGSGKNQDELVVIPLRAARSRVLGSQQEPDADPEEELRTGSEKKTVQVIKYPHQTSYQALDYLVIKYTQPASENAVKKAIEEVLRRRRNLREGLPSDFGIFDPADALATQEAAAKSFSWLLAAVASISLVVGGISVMNTMLVSVTERTREIGLRMAVGARRRDIRNQFLVEAVLLAMLGALAGTVLGVVTAAVIARYGEWPVLISPAVVLLACGCTGLVGVVFGSLPAIRASRLDPMVALRTE
jgi:putative ABC transport system permease protein